MKFFSKIEKIDWFDRILLVLAVFTIVFTGFIFFRKSQYVTVVVKMSEKAWFSQYFYKGMKQYDGLGRTMAEVVDVNLYDSTPSRRIAYITTKLKAVYSRSTKGYTFAGRALVIGSPIKLTFENILIEGIVADVEGVKDPRQKETITVNVRLKEDNPIYLESSGVNEYLADAIKVGDEFKDSRGTVIIKVLDKTSREAQRLVTTSDGRTLVQTNPLKRDVELRLEINAIKIADRYYVFDDNPILIGERIPLNTPEVSLWPEVTEINVFR